MGLELGSVRVHRDKSAHEATDALSARAFANRNHIWLGRRESQTDVHLMAHEVTHTAQQGAVGAKKTNGENGKAYSRATVAVVARENGR